MLCEKCHANKAVVHLTQIVNGQRSELYLCRNCAERANLIESPQDVLSNSFKTMFSSLFPWENGRGMLPLSLPLNGMKLFEARSNIASGVREERYKSFRSRIKPLFTNSEKNATKPAETNPPVDTVKKETAPADEKMKQLQEELQKCIRSENYEEAAEIRDEIKKYSEEN